MATIRLDPPLSGSMTTIRLDPPTGWLNGYHKVNDFPWVRPPHCDSSANAARARVRTGARLLFSFVWKELCLLLTQV